MDKKINKKTITQYIGRKNFKKIIKIKVIKRGPANRIEIRNTGEHMLFGV